MQTSRRIAKDLTIFVGLTLLYFVAGKLGLRLAFVHESATAVWPPTAITLTAMLFLGYRVWPAIFLGAYLVNLTTAGNILTSLGIASGNTLEGIAGVYLLNRFVKGKDSLNRASDIWKFVFWAGAVSTMVSATIGVTTLSVAGFALWENFGPIWLTWWLGGLGGNLILAPFLILWLNKFKVNLTIKNLLYTVILIMAIPLINLVVFGGFITGLEKAYPLEFLVIPFVTLVAFKFRQHGVAAAIIPISGLAIWGTLNGLGPFAGWPLNESLLLLQAFLVVVSVTGLIVGAVVSETNEEKVEIDIEKKQLEILVNNLPVGVFIADVPSGRPILTNKRARELIGRRLKPSTGKEKYTEEYDVVNEKGESYPDDEHPISITIKTKKPAFKDDLVIRHPDGSKVYIKARSVPVFNKEGGIASVLAVFDDITKERMVEIMKNEFVSLVTHQLRTPLGNIRWNIEMLLNGDLGKYPKRLLPILRDIYDSNKKLITLVNDILNVTHIQEAKIVKNPKLTDLSNLIRNLLTDIKSIADEKSVTIEFLTKGNIDKIFIDQKLLADVLQNMISNAVLYSLNKGKVKIILKKVGSNVEISVTDTGIGIPERDKGKIFTKFFRAENAVKSQVQGTGLGLYIAKSYTQILNGEIFFESKEGVGSRFVIRLPVRAKSNA